MAASGSEAVIEQLRLYAEHALKAHPNGSLILFGSIARGDAGPESDLDVLAVRPPGLACDDDAWDDSLVTWRIKARSLSGRCVDLLDAEADEMSVLLNRNDPCVWHEIHRDGIVLAGRPLDEIAGAI